MFLFAGRFVAYKNLPLVIKAFDYLYQKYRSGKLELVGGGPDEITLKTLVQSLVSAPAISFFPALPQAQLFERIKQATVCLAPALTEFNPNFILEGLSLGRPAVISRPNGLTVSLPSEWQFDPQSLDSLIKALERWYDQAYLNHAQTLITQIPFAHGWDEVITEHLKLLKVVTII